MIELDADHIYRVDGQVTPGVSEILQASGKVTKFYKGTEARERGTEIHKLLEDYDNGELFPLQWEHLDPCYLTEYKSFIHGLMANYCLISAERLFYHNELNYCGKLDREFIHKVTGARAVVDIKTGTTLPGFTALQLAAYAMGLHPFDYLKVERIALHLHPKNKTYRIKEFNDPKDFHEWERIVKQYHATHN